MYIKNIELTHFRNFAQLSLNINRGINTFLGDNGQGKTNLLESIFLISKSQSFRAGKNDVFIPFADKRLHSCILARVAKKNLQYEIKISFEQGKKAILVNGKKVSSTFLLSRFPMVLFSPESLAAIKAGPEARRSLVDEFLISYDPGNGRLLTDFKRCLRSRNALLRDTRLGKWSPAEGRRMLDSINPIYFRLATELTWARIEALRQLQPDIQSAMRYIQGAENVDISVDYTISSASAMSWNPQQVRDALQKRSDELALAELEAGSTLIGPHKHDILFLFNGRDSRYFCSQGQQRALILSFKMAQIMYHHRAHQEYPVLLLDDVLSELDHDKKLNLIEFLKGINSQIILTTTDFSLPQDFGTEQLSVFKIRQGNIELASQRVGNE